MESFETGVAKLVTILADGLAALNHEVHLLYSETRANPAAVERLQATGRVRLVPLRMRRGIHWRDFGAATAIARYLQVNGPFDVVHGHSAKGGALARLVRPRPPTALVYTPHAFVTLDPSLSRTARAFYATVERLLSRWTDMVICSSEGERLHALDLGLKAPVEVVLNVVETPPPAHRNRAGLGVPEDAFVLGFVARLEPQKAPELLLHALAVARTRGADPWAVIAGDGALRDDMEQLASSLEINDRLVWLGQTPDLAFLASVDVLILTSRYEGFSLMPLEAMHRALPIIVTEVPGVAETVIDGETGIVVPVGDRDAIACAIVALAVDPAKRQAMGRAALQRAKLFSAEGLVTAHTALYQRVLRSKRSGRPVDEPSGVETASPELGP